VVAFEGIDKLCSDPQAVARFLNAPFQDVANPKILGHLLNLHGLALVRERRVARNDKEGTDLGETRYNVLSDTVT